MASASPGWLRCPYMTGGEQVTACLSGSSDPLCIDCLATATTLSWLVVAQEIGRLGSRVEVGPPDASCGTCGRPEPAFVAGSRVIRASVEPRPRPGLGTRH
jgi:hypothetical protein